MPIYSGAGDGGETGLFGGGRIAKDHLRVEAYGAVDELNAVLGVARAAGIPGDLDDLARRLQNELFVLGADLATPADTSASKDRIVRLDGDAASRLETEIDRCEEGLPSLDSFILPGGHPAAAALHMARAVCRRAERRTVSLQAAETISEAAVPYLNRLGDLLFVMARLANARAGHPEPTWKPR